MDIRKKWKVLIGVALLSTQGFAQINTYQFEQLDSLQKIEKRKVVVFIHTDWCKYCQAMKNTTFKNPGIIREMNGQFYFIALDAEYKHDISYFGQTFSYKPTGLNAGTHDLANALGTQNGIVSYPGLCILNENNEIIFQHNQFMNADDLLHILEKLH